MNLMLMNSEKKIKKGKEGKEGGAAREVCVPFFRERRFSVADVF